MKRNTFLFLLSLFVYIVPIEAQSYRAMYEGEEVNLYDGEVIRDLFILEVSSNGMSSFQSYYALQRDSIRDASIQEGLSMQESIAKMRSIQAGSKSRLYYDPSSKQFTDLDYGLNYFRAVDNISNVEYVFGDSTKMVSGYSSEMATAHLYGRDWVIYYSTEIPLPYGPWKINGLPGLVTEVYTLDGAYKFKLSGFEVIDRELKIAVPTMMLNQPVIEVSREELAWIRKQVACMDMRPIIKKYSKNYDMSGMYHEKIDQKYRELSKRYQYIEQ